jgi:hypothetical protein
MANVRGRTVLYVAARNGHTETVTALIYRYTNVNAAGEDRLIVLKLADNNGHIEMLRVLIVELATRWEEAKIIDRNGRKALEIMGHGDPLATTRGRYAGFIRCRLKNHLRIRTSACLACD